jgi:hypothetical protein
VLVFGGRRKCEWEGGNQGSGPRCRSRVPPAAAADSSASRARSTERFFAQTSDGPQPRVRRAR